MGEIESPGRASCIDSGRRTTAVGNGIRVSVCDVVRMLYASKNNPYIEKFLDKYNIEKSSLKDIKKALKKGGWKTL